MNIVVNNGNVIHTDQQDTRSRPASPGIVIARDIVAVNGGDCTITNLDAILTDNISWAVSGNDVVKNLGLRRQFVDHNTGFLVIADLIVLDQDCMGIGNIVNMIDHNANAILSTAEGGIAHSDQDRVGQGAVGAPEVHADKLTAARTLAITVKGEAGNIGRGFVHTHQRVHGAVPGIGGHCGRRLDDGGGAASTRQRDRFVEIQRFGVGAINHIGGPTCHDRGDGFLDGIKGVVANDMRTRTHREGRGDFGAIRQTNPGIICPGNGRGSEIQANDYRVVVAGSVLMRQVEIWIFELGVVVDHRGFIRVDVPEGHIGNLRGGSGGGEGMIEIAGCAVKDVGVTLGCGHKGGNLVHQAAVRQHGNRVFGAVGVQVAHHEHVRVEGQQGGFDEVKQRRGLQHAFGIPAALAVALVSIRAAGGAAALGFKVVGHHHKLFTGGNFFKFLGEGRAVEN